MHGKIKGMLTPEEENEHRLIQSSGTFVFVTPSGVCLPLTPGLSTSYLHLGHLW